MTYTIKDISVVLTFQSGDYVNLEIRHKNKLILDTITVAYHFGNLAIIEFNKPYIEKYLGLVVEWIVNNHKIGNIRAALRYNQYEPI